MRREFYLNKRIRELMPSDVFCMRVENTAMPGTPDIYIARDGRVAWIESKIISNMHKLKVSVREPQEYWHALHRKLGGAVWIVASHHMGTKRPNHYLLLAHELDEKGGFTSEWYETTGRGLSLRGHLETIIESMSAR